MIETFYTGTNRPERIESYRQGIFFMNGTKQRNADVGDFGAGVYFDQSKHRARCYGRYVFQVEVDMEKILFIGNAYREEDVEKNAPFIYPILMKPDPERIMGRKMMTVQASKDERWETAVKIREACLEKGYLGIYSEQGVGKAGEKELVLFSNEPVTSYIEVTDEEQLSFDALKDHVGDKVTVINPSLKSYAEEGVILFVNISTTNIRFSFRTMWIKNKNLELVKNHEN